MTDLRQEQNIHTILDCRGLVCPQPVIRAKELLDSPGQSAVEVLVDNEAARSNLTRFGKSQGYEVASHSAGEAITITISKKQSGERAAKEPAPETSRCDRPGAGLICVTPAETMGRGSDPLGGVLMRAYIKTLKNINPLPAKIFFYNSGVKITATESDLIAPLKELTDLGVEIFSCGTCLDFFNLKDDLLVGQVTNMFE